MRSEQVKLGGGSTRWERPWEMKRVLETVVCKIQVQRPQDTSTEASDKAL
jgi:hypothetical protein